MPVLFRLLMLFGFTVVGGVVATLLVPAIASSQALPASYPRAVSAAPVTWSRAVATRTLTRGDTLRTDDFVIADSLLHGRLPFGVDTTTPVTGWLIRRTIMAGEWLRAPSVVPRPVVTAGQSVKAFWSDGSVLVAVDAIALNSAAAGEPVSVRIGRTRRLDGIAIAPDSVRLR